MGMNIGAASGSEPDVMSEINTTPLIDVMLVLLIMLIITIPIQLHSVNLNLPVSTPAPPTKPPEAVRIDIGADNVVRWNGETLDSAALEARLAAAATLETVPELHVRPDSQSAYRTLAGVMAAIQRHGLTKIGIVGNEQYL